MGIKANYYIGVDGGGTSCRARIIDAQGQFIGEAKTTSANLLLGCQLAMDAIQTAIWQAAQQGGLSANDLSQASVGLALAAAEQASAWHEFMRLSHPYQHVQLNTDAYGACLGAWQGQNGAILIAGTGSCGLLLKDGKQFVVGGREFPISDQGGGAIMGLSLIQKTLLATDDILPTTPLVSYILAHFDHNIDAIVAWSKSARPCDYGQFSPAVFQYAEQNDPMACQLLQETASYIDMWIQALRHKGADKICLMGGIGERIRPWLNEQTIEHLTPPQGDAMDGALLMARHHNHNLYSFPQR